MVEPPEAAEQTGAVTPSASTPLRVIVNFHPSAVLDQQSLLDTVAKETGATFIHLISANAAGTWVLQIQAPKGQSTEALLTHIKQIKSVKSVELDAKAKQH